MSESSAAPNRQQDLYWKQLVQLKVSCEYIRRYRNQLASWVTGFAVLRAIASVGAIGTWAVVKAYPMVWGGIIAATQIGDALQGAIPFNRRQHATSALVMALDTLFIDALMEWEDIFAGRLNEVEITARRHKLMKLQHDAEAKHFPTGLPERRDLFRLAEADAANYFRATFDTGPV